MSHPSMVLASSPLVGPLAMERLGAALADAGVEAIVPPAPLDVAEFVDAIATAIDPGRTVLVGYSAAGPRLFAVAARRSPAAIAFVDARLPADGVAPSDETEFADLLDRLPRRSDGMLPPWTSWWPDEVVARLCPDPELRRRLAAGCPPVPRTLFDEPIPAPPYAGPCGYLALGDGYADQRDLAEARGWPTTTVDGHHLAPLTDPQSVAAALLDLIVELVA